MRRSSIVFVLLAAAFFIAMGAVAMQRLGVFGPYHPQQASPHWDN